MDYHFNFNDPLNDEDKENETYGCRQNNPSICKNNGLEGICAFCRKDHICKKPSKAWQKQFEILKKGN